MLKGEPLKINHSNPFNANEKTKHKSKQRVYKKPITLDTSLEQNRPIESRLETEPVELEEGLKKALSISPTNRPVNHCKLNFN